MSRTPARFTEADIRRAAKVAVEHGLRVRVNKAGDILLEREAAPKESPQVDSQQPEWAM